MTATIATRSHLGEAAVLRGSILRWNPTARSFLLLVDGEADVPDRTVLEQFELVTLDQLGIPDLSAFCFQYTPFELSNALKPYFLRWLLSAKNVPAVLYLDADIAAFSSLDALWTELRSHQILFTQHTAVDYPDDGCFPDRASLAWGGRYNGGVIGVRRGPSASRFLDWWADRLGHDCLDEPASGHFVDQKPLDLVQDQFTDVGVSELEGVNVAHFNLHARRLARKPNGWRVNDQLLTLFHFTCVDFARLDFAAPVNRQLLREQPILREFFAEHAAARARLHADDYRKLEYRFARFANGRLISLADRRWFRATWMAGCSAEVVLQDLQRSGRPSDPPT